MYTNLSTSCIPVPVPARQQEGLVSHPLSNSYALGHDGATLVRYNTSESRSIPGLGTIISEDSGDGPALQAARLYVLD